MGDSTCRSIASAVKDVFGIDNSEISFAKKERIDKQYYFDFKVSEKDVMDMIQKAERFNNTMTVIL
ncbi:MAG: hypothetical protein HZB65_02450 [Candidatus Aenigmarchaeota archaeon]|nr:hypothetical protein [Candidatus Aenigmarchaeota archaeon]